MYGPPQPPSSPQGPSSGGLIALRVLFVVLALGSCGFLGWAPLLRLAVVTRRKVDWALFGTALAAATGLFVYIGLTAEKEGSDLEAFLGVGTLVALAAGSIAYYLVAEIRHFERRAAAAVPPPYAYPYGGAPGTAVTVPNPAPGPHAYGYPPVPPPVTGAAHGAAPAPRIEQVKAELDELSDLLRKDRGTAGEGEGHR
ncbi:hypothetical protein [Streptomyces sp. NPDC003327]